MKVAHFAVFAPHGSGQYMTVKDLILAEQSVGIDARFIDYGHEGKPQCRVGLVDGNITTAPLEWADEVDIAVRHSSIPNHILNSKVIVMALHGRPESSFKLEQLGKIPVISTLLDAASSGIYKAFVTFWPEHMFYWSNILLGANIVCIPPPVDLNTYNPWGNKGSFGEYGGKPNIIITDMWREDTTPFNIVFAAKRFRDLYCHDAKLHIYGLPHKNSCINFLSPLKKSGLIGKLSELVINLDEIYRASDFLITPNTIATRVIREAMASGVPFVAPSGCRYTDYTADPRNVEEFALAMKQCWDDINIEKQSRDNIHLSAMSEFGLEMVGKSIKKVFEGCLNEIGNSLQSPRQQACA